MSVGSKSLTENAGADVTRNLPENKAVKRMSPGRAWVETLWVFALLESWQWTARGVIHSILVVLLLVSPIALTILGGYDRKQLGLTWPSRKVTLGIIAAGFAIAIAFPLGARLLGHPVPADSNWPRLSNIVPYLLWALFQQFLLQSFIFLRMEVAAGSSLAVWISSAFFTFAHLPNLPLTFLTLFGALFFTDLFRRYRSIYPLGIAHFLMGISIAYSFPTSLMHHMRVGLSFWKM